MSVTESLVDYDPDIFAFLIPMEEKARTAFALKQNKRRFVKGTPSGVAVENLISSRETTPAPQSLHEQKNNRLDRIVLRFSDELTNPFEGIQLGTHSQSDVFLGLRGTRGVSARQCTIAIDDNLWIWLHDYKSTYGTAVGYEDKLKDEIRCRETWILAYAPGDYTRWVRILVNVSGMQFQVVFPNHAAATPVYVANLRAFRDRVRNATPPFNLDLNATSRVTTAAPSQSLTPRKPDKQPLYIDDGFIGKGSFGEVRRVIMARDGMLYAMKKCFPPVAVQETDGAEKRNKATSKKNKKRKRVDSAWRTWLDKVHGEYKLMKDNPHPNVMRVVDFQELSDGPVVVMPYYGWGSLESYGPVSENQCIVVLLQLLSGLRHLHQRGVVHRDLKLANLLVGEPFHIVIADFGLSKFDENGQFTTFCGTLETAAPEVFPGARATKSSPYGTKADVWSAGVIIVELYLNGLPHPPDKNPYRKKNGPWHKWNEEWCKLLFDKVHEHDENNDQLIELLLHMLEPDPQIRLSSEECLEHGCQTGLFRKTPDGTHVPGTDPAAFLLDQGADGDKTPTKSLQPSPAISPQSIAGTPCALPMASLVTAVHGSLWGDLDRGDSSEHYGGASAIQPPSNRPSRVGDCGGSIASWSKTSVAAKCEFDLPDDISQERDQPIKRLYEEGSTEQLGESPSKRGAYRNYRTGARPGKSKSSAADIYNPSPSSLTTFEKLVAEFEAN